MFFLFSIGLLFLILRGTAPHSSDLVVFAASGDSVTLPCNVSSGSRCSSISWTKDHNGFEIDVVREGRLVAPNITLLKDCSLHISYMENDNASIYTCYNGNKNSSVDLQCLIIAETENKDKIELHCYLNNYIGLIRPCNKTGLKISWFAEDNTQLKGERFQIENKINCFSKLKIQPKKTDHHRKWKCQASLNGSATAITSYQTTVSDGIEEVFAAVSESVSLTCTKVSSLALTDKSQTSTSFSNTASATIIRNVRASNSGEYQCEDKGKGKKIWLHTVDIISEMDSKGENVTLTCVLTCASTTCDTDFNLTWSEDDTPYITSGLLKGNRSLINKLSVPKVHLGTGDSVCSVLREGAQVATKTWRYSNSLHGLAWITLPIALLCFAAILLLYRKRKHNKYPENLQANIGLTNVYEDVQDCGPKCKREAITSNDSFYDLLQAVN
ncbi:uncharacterized protein LOC110171758 isoform X2 [Boleophthalmus pectinirostris]|uniref:uncharacterized protein LOC110171758 isoform X2 n=1 Tax=Boleophthalmus pectinirostris TaxID=150288 RepID=UPI00242C555B|nr:uncharacterized protein LOC110171758 isoform X2 [Boleophthalmus pectinirostris]